MTKRLFNGIGQLNKFGLEFTKHGSECERIVEDLAKFCVKNNIDSSDFQYYISSNLSFYMALANLERSE